MCISSHHALVPTADWSLQAFPVVYVLPLPIATYVPYAFQCMQTISYATDSLDTNVDPETERSITQANCDYDRFANEYLATMPPFSDESFPYVCPPGFFGNTTNVADQKTQSCSGPCRTSPSYNPRALLHKALHTQPIASWTLTERTNPDLAAGGHFCPHKSNGQGCIHPKPCPRGTYSPSPGLSEQNECLDCPPGHWCGEATVMPTVCAAGLIGASRNNHNASCDGPCPLGYYCLEGATNGHVCPPGTFGAQTGLSSKDNCTKCPHGQWCHTGVATNCSIGFYSPGGINSTALHSCKQCPPKSTTHSMGMSRPEDCVCQQNYYSKTQNAEGEVDCEPLPEGTNTAGIGTTVGSLTINKGYWRANRYSKIKPCPYPTTCAGGVAPPGDYNASSGAVCVKESGTCGAFCRLCCDADAYFDHFKHRCRLCGTRETLALSILGGVVVLLILTVVAWRSSALPALVRKKWWWRRVALFVHSTGLRTKIKILISNYQVITQLGSVYVVKYPGSYLSLLAKFQFISNSAIFTDIPGLNPACMGLRSLWSRLWFSSLTPLGIIVAALGISRASAGSILPAVPFCLAWSFLALPFVSSLGFRVLAPCDCFSDLGTPQSSVDVITAASSQRPDPLAPIGSIEHILGLRTATASNVTCFNREDYSVLCDGEEYESVLAAAIFAVAVYAVALPLLYLGVLLMCRRALLIGPPTKFSNALKFLHADYMPHTYLWELVEIFRKLTLTGFFAVVWTGTVLQLFAGLLAAILFFALQVSAQPYRQPTSNYLGIVMAASITFTFLFTVVMQTLLGIDDGRMMTPQAETFIVIALCTAALSVLVGMGVVVLAQTAAERRKLVLFWDIDSEAVQAPKLPLKKRFHAFISHRSMALRNPPSRGTLSWPSLSYMLSLTLRRPPCRTAGHLRRLTHAR